MSASTTNSPNAKVIVTRPDDPRLAFINIDADCFSQQFDGEATFITVRPTATDEKLESVARKFNINVSELRRVRDEQIAEGAPADSKALIAQLEAEGKLVQIPCCPVPIDSNGTLFTPQLARFFLRDAERGPARLLAIDPPGEMRKVGIKVEIANHFSVRLELKDGTKSTVAVRNEQEAGDDYFRSLPVKDRQAIVKAVRATA